MNLSCGSNPVWCHGGWRRGGVAPVTWGLQAAHVVLCAGGVTHQMGASLVWEWSRGLRPRHWSQGGDARCPRGTGGGGGAVGIPRGIGAGELLLGGKNRNKSRRGTSNIAEQPGEEQIQRDADINRLDRTHHVAGAIGFQEPRTLAPRGIIPTMPPPDCLVPYIHEAGFGGPLQMRSFDYDMPLVSALVERWRPETHSFHIMGGVHDHVAGTAVGRLRSLKSCGR
ncbi:hypothetical protein PIB30_081070 [Stylosanthes scabra]|uniref:Aminotransferase-like plant mobile domain-containing protein n=1 Tax=Stylosanthes scabra TaxID=79078 RepID=A0ABU6RRG3_9FABA|nr:hypothetical protein [Stylosanthes scabra]